MEKKYIIGVLATIFLSLTLFMPMGTDTWKFPLLIGLVFGVAWFFMKD